MNTIGFQKSNNAAETERRTIVIGDIHGCSRALDTLIDRFQLAAHDRVIILGDAIDRGPDSRGVLDRLHQIRKTTELVYIQGNHEEMILRAFERTSKTWLRNGGNATLASYGGDLKRIPDEHRDLLNRTVTYWEEPTAVCVHANLEPGVPLDQQNAVWLRWRKLRGSEFPLPSGKSVICGHTPVGGEIPRVQNGWVCLDTSACEGGYLSAVEIHSGEVLQSRQTGEFRRGLTLSEIETKSNKRIIPLTVPLQQRRYAAIPSIFRQFMEKISGSCTRQ